MFRIKTTTRAGVEFLSPFVFEEDQAEKKIKSIEKWHTWQGWPKFKVVPAEKYSKMAIWDEQHPIFGQMVSDSMGMLRILEEERQK